MSLVVAIDVGIRNVGLCVFDFVTNKVIHWDNTELLPGKYIPSQNVMYVRDFVLRYNRFFENALMVVVERQMRANMRIIEAVLQSFFFERCVVVSPRSVKAHYGLSTHNYSENKRVAVEWADNFVRRNASVFDCDLHKWSGKKRDDMADALLLVMYYLDTYSNQSVDLYDVGQ